MLEFAPDIGGTGNLTSRNVLKEALSSNDPLRTDVREYSEGMSYGWEDPMWIEEAHESMEMRVRGDLGTGIWDDDEEEEEDEVEEEEEEEKDESFELDYDEEQDVVKQEVSKEKGKRKAADDVEPVTGDTKEAWWKDPDLQ